MDGIGPSARLITKICDWAKYDNRLWFKKYMSDQTVFFSKMIPSWESFWQNHRLVTHILFELQPIIIFSPVANFGDQSLALLYSYLAVQRKSTAAAGTRT